MSLQISDLLMLKMAVMYHHMMSANLVIAIRDMDSEHSEGAPPTLRGHGLVTGLDVDVVGLSLLKVQLLHNCHEAL